MRKNVTVKVNGEVLTFDNTQTTALQAAGSPEVVRFNEISDTTATASDVKKGETFYDHLGVKRIGTHECSGGGGGEGDGTGYPVDANNFDEMWEGIEDEEVGRIFLWNPPIDPISGDYPVSPWIVGELYIVVNDSETGY